ncbi:MAG TPA: hypothetical protein VF791_06725 [Pyrinomonadaceae bacterium]
MKKTEYQSKITDDNGFTRARVPSPLLRTLGARAGDLVTFRLSNSKVTLQVLRSQKKSTKKRR